jgi:hypothetical protein
MKYQHGAQRRTDHQRFQQNQVAQARSLIEAFAYHCTDDVQCVVQQSGPRTGKQELGRKKYTGHSLQQKEIAVALALKRRNTARRTENADELNHEICHVNISFCLCMMYITFAIVAHFPEYARAIRSSRKPSFRIA